MFIHLEFCFLSYSCTKQPASESLTPSQIILKVAHMKEFPSQQHLENDEQAAKRVGMCLKPKEERETISSVQHQLWKMAALLST